MKKFILEAVVTIALVYLTGFLLYRIDNPAHIPKRLHKVEGKIEIFNLGNSHGGNFEYGNCPYNGVKISKAANTLYYDLQNYLFLKEENYLAEEAIVIIPVSYFSFGLDENRTDKLPDDSFVNDYYFYLPKEQIFSYSKDKKASLVILNIQKNFQNILTEWTKVKDKKPVDKPKKEKQNKQADKLKSTKNKKQTFEAKFGKYAHSRAKRDKRLSSFSDKQKNLNYLKSLIEEALKNKHTPILITAPYHYTYNEGFGRAWLKENYFSVLKTFSTKYNIPYLDYSHDDRFCFEADYFYNADHLNGKGRKVFSTIVFNDIEKILKEDIRMSKKY